jgi:putative ABC transport system permease protein
VTVAGILEDTGGADDYHIFLPLSTLQEATGKQGLISSLDVRALCNGCPVEIIADTINDNIAGVRAVAVKQVAAAEMGIVDRIRGFMLGLAGITLLVGALGVVNTMIASVHERTRDIGIMKVVGASQLQIVIVFVYEAVLIGLVGGALGYLLGTVLAFGVGPMVFEGAPVSFVPSFLPLAIGVALLVAVLSVAYPAYRATRIKAAECFRSL